MKEVKYNYLIKIYFLKMIKKFIQFNNYKNTYYLFKMIFLIKIKNIFKLQI